MNVKRFLTNKILDFEQFIHEKYLSFFPNECLVVVGDGAGWSLDQDIQALARIMSSANARVFFSSFPWKNQTAFFASRNEALEKIRSHENSGVSVCFPYFHGYPGEGNKEFDDCFELLRKHHSRISRIQVTHSRMFSYLLETGVDPAKLHMIRIGIDSKAFVIPTPEQRVDVRKRFGIPLSAVVIGSFQKDGNGWGEGLEPKLIKGPDTFLKVIDILKERIPELFVFLSGPARGYVMQGLKKAKVPYVHKFASTYEELPNFYHALDAYVVTSRQEGGPKAILESMATGVPIVSTRVGQATDLISHGESGWLSEIDASESLAQFVQKSLSEIDWQSRYRKIARRIAEENDYLTQIDAWKEFFRGIVRFS